MVDLVNTTSGITRLNNHNYQSWRSCIKSYLEGQDLWEVINGDDTEPPTNAYKLIKWKVKAGKVMYVLKSTIEDELLRQIKDDDTPKMAWDTFASLFSNTNDAQLQYGAIISLLIKQKPELMRQLDNRGKAAIHHAIEAEYWFLHDRMLEADASIALFPDADGYTPLLTASKRGCLSACENILKICPESIEARDHNGRNALHLCQFWTYRHGLRFVKIPEIWELLNVGDDEGNTPLHVAVKESDYEKAILIMSSVDLGAVNKEGLTALDLCESDWRHLNKQRLMWIHLRRLGAPRGRRPNKHMVPIGGLGDNRFIRSPDEDSKPVFNTRSVVAALIATVTFTAALAMPGGYDSSGEANLVKKPALWAFILSDALAMCCSIAVLFLLLGAMVVERDLQTILSNASVSLLSIAILATLAAFMSGIFAIIAPKALWVAILACIVCSMVLYLSRYPIVVRYPLSTWFMPSIITRDILRLIHLKQQRNKIKRDRRYVVSLIRRGSPDTTYCVSNNNTVNS